MNYTAFPLENQRNEAVRHALANKYMTDGTCGEISFGASGGRTRIPMFPNHLKLMSIATHAADARPPSGRLRIPHCRRTGAAHASTA